MEKELLFRKTAVTLITVFGALLLMAMGHAFPGDPSYAGPVVITERNVSAQEANVSRYSGDGTWLTNTSAYVTVCSSGCDYITDGTADDVQIRAAMNSLHNGGTVYIRNGTYDITSTLILHNGIRLLGEGYPAENTGTKLYYSANDGTNAIEIADDTDYYELQHLVIQGTANAAQGHGIYINNSGGLEPFKSIMVRRFQGPGKYGIYFNATINNMHIEGIQVKNNNGGIHFKKVNVLTLTNSRIASNTQAGVNISHGSLINIIGNDFTDNDPQILYRGGTANQVHNINIEGNWFEASGSIKTGINLTGNSTARVSNAIITGNGISGMDSGLYLDYVQFPVIENNWFIANALDIDISANSRYVCIRNNRLEDTVPYSSSYHCRQESNITMSNNVITDIGNAGTDFTAGGGLALAENLTASAARFVFNLTMYAPNGDAFCCGPDGSGAFRCNSGAC